MTLYAILSPTLDDVGVAVTENMATSWMLVGLDMMMVTSGLCVFTTPETVAVPLIVMV